jgi:hypothetical protein
MPDHAATILRANLDRLRGTEPALAQRLEGTAPADVEWSDSKAGPPAAAIEHLGKSLALCSRYDPHAEADKLLAGVDPTKHAGIIVLGAGLGYHVAQAARFVDATCIMVLFEPNLPLLRAVFERIDCTAWLGKPNILIIDDADDRAALTARLEKFAAILTQGTILIAHPPSRRISGDAFATFGKAITDIIAYCRTTVATSLVNMARTVRNLSMNVAYYAAGATTNELHRAAVGCPAVCVSAGPSLARNVQLLTDPAVRGNVIVITAQTTLKPLLDRGIRPDFVTALDYHEISRRFYEGLPDLPEVTLVAEAKAHHSVLDGYPGPIRVTRSAFLDKMLGSPARPIVPIAAGATVAHLSFYLAQHLGCDPIILIGQDLGFSDGLYYCPGTAIHDVWAPELNAFNTVEMMEWQRIVRHRGNLQRTEDIHGRPMFTDEQMVTYLRQFERDFLAAPQIVIDATEGGAAKLHTKPMRLADALKQYAVAPAPRLPLPDEAFDTGRLRQVRDLMRQRLDECREIRRHATRTIPLLRDMKKHQRDPRRFDKLYDKVQQHKRAVEGFESTFNLINDLNTLGTFKRARADRAIMRGDGDDFEQQRLIIDRDINNIEWLIQVCDEATAIFTDALTRLDEARQRQEKAVA